MIYLAAPFSHENPAVMAARLQSLCEFHAMLVRKPPRSFFYNPLANAIGAAHEEIPESYWVNHGLHVLKSCQALYVLMLPGWENSKGVTKEIAFAHEIGITVHYFNASGIEVYL
jgi:hypothetical protein